MFDQANRSVWLAEQLWPKLREQFDLIQRLPAEALVTVGYPSSGARGRSEKIRPCEVNFQWQGNDNEKVFLAVHPVYFDTPINVAKALLFGAAKWAGGARWGARHVGVHKSEDGTLTCTDSTQAKLDKIIVDCGDVPPGFGVAFPVRSVQRARLRKYVAEKPWCLDDSGKYRKDSNDNAIKHPVLRIASDTATVACSECHIAYKLQ